ncbi:type IV secretion system protein [Nitrosovibrio sp. Nv6]|uniref:type IV secretion system protein n=1 Tax=Nitrosovibrio sp. Nv6 TaxID=1855340 RepID=UPI0008BED0F2|nr:type IV secretion system protein [Nitrosovibrio sp. Nv6]SEP43217.1 TrbL/VirB6 plasmid conjugal transfer protein [Nitrosovibrio sp. Nv6]
MTRLIIILVLAGLPGIAVAAENPFGVSLVNHLLQQLQEYRESIGSQFTGAFINFFRLFVLLYVVVIGYRVMMGMMGERTKSAAISIALVIVLHGVVVETGAFRAWIEEPIIGATLGLARMFGDGGSGGSLFGRLDASIATIVGTVEAIEPGGNLITNTMIYIQVTVACAVLLIVVCGMYLVYLAQVSLALVSLYLLMMVGAPFIFFAAFPESRFITWTWFKAVMNYALWTIFLSLIMAIGITGIEETAKGLANWDVVRDGVFTRNYAFAVGFSTLMIYFLLKSSDLAAALSGGMGMQSNVAASGLSAAGSALGSGIGMVGAAAAPMAKVGAVLAAQGASKVFSAMKGITR